ncbi:MAG: LysR substrate-binding domain-containing protein [Filomicrobium sp.]
MELKQLRCFVAVSETLHFGRAAERLHMAQPALSAQIKALELEVGSQLFFRTTRKVALSTTGLLFLEEAREILERSEKALQRARLADTDSIGWLRIGAVDTATAGLLPGVIRDFRRIAPEVDLRVSELLTAPALEAIANHHIDLAFVRTASSDRFVTSRLLFREPLMAVVASGNKLARKRAVKREDLAGMPLVLPPRIARPIYHDMLRDWFRDGDLVPSIAHEANERHTILALVAAGLGVSILPSWVSHFRHRDVVFRPIADPPLVGVHLARRRALVSPAADMFEEIVDRHVPKYPFKISE